MGAAAVRRAWPMLGTVPVVRGAQVLMALALSERERAVLWRILDGRLAPERADRKDVDLIGAAIARVMQEEPTWTPSACGLRGYAGECIPCHYEPDRVTGRCQNNYMRRDEHRYGPRATRWWDLYDRTHSMGAAGCAVAGSGEVTLPGQKTPAGTPPQF